jgi:hypothetical protein
MKGHILSVVEVPKTPRQISSGCQHLEADASAMSVRAELAGFNELASPSLHKSGPRQSIFLDGQIVFPGAVFAYG